MVTNARPGESYHQFGRAFDVVFLDESGGRSYEGPWPALAEIGEELGLVAGIRWGDSPHFEFRGLELRRQRRPSRAAYDPWVDD